MESYVLGTIGTGFSSQTRGNILTDFSAFRISFGFVSIMALPRAAFVRGYLEQLRLHGMLHPTLPADAGDSRSQVGVFQVDPHHPPVVPPDARAVEICNSDGQTIAFAWVIPEHAEALRDAAWQWYDEHGATARPRLTLHRG
jgi:hypothetical protein